MASLGKGGDYTDPPINETNGESSSTSSSSPSPAQNLGKGSDQIQQSDPVPIVTPAPTQTPASTDPWAHIQDIYPSSAVPICSFGNVYTTVGDVPKESVSYALPKADYRNACYMWQVPNYEVVVPGAPYYRMPINHDMLSAFGFLDTDTLDEVFVVSDCSDWESYANGRASGQWGEIQRQITQQGD